jgi:hypothetical protein
MEFVYRRLSLWFNGITGSDGDNISSINCSPRLQVPQQQQH